MDGCDRLRWLHLTLGKARINRIKYYDTIMKNYLKPEFQIFEVAVEGGYGDSVGLPGFGTENDELVY